MKNKKNQVQVKAKVSFWGEVSASAGAVFLCPGDIAKKLITGGYVEMFKNDSLISEGEYDVKNK